MSRVFKRPMFRRGGSTNDGIMSGIRENYKDGSARERLQRVAAEYPQQGFDPLTQFLIQGGLNLVSQPSTGGVLSDIATAAKEPTAQLFKGMAEKGKLQRELALAGEQLDIESEQAERLARIKNQQKEFFASQTPEAQFEVLTDLYKESTIPVIKNNAADLADFRLRHKKQPYVELDYEYSRKTKKFEPNFTAIPVGALTFDPSAGKAYRRNKDGTFTALDPITLEPIENVNGTE
jgi:hypothetical protein